MAINFRLEERRVIPNWRDFRRTVKLNELGGIGTGSGARIDIIPRIDEWSTHRSIGTAADLINGAFLANEFGHREVREASEYVLSNADKASPVLLSVAAKMNQGALSADQPFKTVELEVDSWDDFETHLENDTIYRILRSTRYKAHNEIRNPVVWVELSRLYAFLGLEIKAEKAMIIALQLAPNNRYVLRSATRLFIHFEMPEKALHYLRKSESTRFDPWLLSAHIATSSLMQRFSPLIKNGVAIAASQNFSSYDLTELNSSLGTLEYYDGALKKAKRYIHESSRAPNDNSLAQMEWLSYRDSAFSFDATYHDNVANPFEAFAYDAYQAGNWTNVLENCVYWFMDIPYSRRPVLLGSYIASMILEKHDLCVRMCKAALKANPNDITLLNNATYGYLMMNQLDEAGKYLDMMTVRLKTTKVSDEELITVQATFGLAAFREGNLELGQRLYESAIEDANKKKKEHLERLASIIYVRELILNKCDSKVEEFVRSLEKLDVSSSKELQFLKGKVMSEFRDYQLRQIKK